jgi:Protein of unknown function (DUF1524)
MNKMYRVRRVVLMSIAAGLIGVAIILQYLALGTNDQPAPQDVQPAFDGGTHAITALNKLDIKGRAPKTNYSRDKFGTGWVAIGGCDTRNIILNRDLTDTLVDESCQVQKGTLNDPYTGLTIMFTRGPGSSSAVQIDHVVALSDAWQKGAQQMTYDTRVNFANDPLELLAVDGPANQQKSDGDAATWLPSYIPFRCQYVARQIAVKQKYSLWVTMPEYEAMKKILDTCPQQLLPDGID